jgi:pimeloyl-ACP methyl ester carboxylesterase
MKKLIVIHGALGSAKEFDDISPLLEDRFDVIPYDLPHHGSKRNSGLPFNLDTLVNELLAFLEDEGKCIIYGFSLGGYVALCAALRNPNNIEGIITQGTKLEWSPEIAAKEVKSLDTDFLQFKVAPFYNYLVELHGDYLSSLLKKTASFMLELGKDPALSPRSLRKLNVPVRMIRGGKDKMVSEEETMNVVQRISNSFYFEVPFFPHPLGFIKPKHIARMITVQAGSLHYKWTDTSRGRMAYKTIGNFENNSTCLLFLHEAIGSIAQWNSFPHSLSEKLKLPAIVPEFPGYGFSSADNKKRDHTYLHEFATQVLPEFINNVCENKDLIIIGHSDGGTNALLYSSEFPDRVKGIVTMAAHYINEEETRAGIHPAIRAYEEGKLKGLQLYHGKKTEDLFYNWARTWLDQDFEDWNISNDIRGMAAPALIIQGDEDQYGTKQQVKGICQLIENGESFYIQNCGHAPHIEQENEVIQKITEWKTRLA